jgi:hypothetical protein
MVLEAAGSNYTLRSKTVLYELKNPLRMMAGPRSFSAWCAALTMF